MGAFQKGTILWPGGIVPYQPNATHPFWPLIIRAINEMNDKTVVKFIERTNQTDYVYFTSDNTGNWSISVGKAGGPHQVNIDKNVRSLHELGHVIGLIHEHQRQDRDNFIEIKRDFIDSGNEWNKNNLLDTMEIEYETEYDVHSFMQYWDTAGVNNETKNKELAKRIFTGIATIGISEIGPNVEGRSMVYKRDKNLRISTSEFLSPLDIVCINNVYRNYAPAS
ncbi:3847_t:CDS:1 [Funneliformis geosporum]|uniref:Metalloendopeptidase n=1 Tax=Funneliformis geosporum TaxID=1117311 RepID=A0A9W4SE81_9GLOM|nr:3847_t:CDS:1 [Funneliformis geosporum]CAI2165725.1 10975_t:CDS:1 [Funneliformis geosporum]